MTIKFICSCGKRLRARDHMAARRLACPRCGAPIGIPTPDTSADEALAAPFEALQRAARLQPRQARDEAVPGWMHNEAAAEAAADLANRLRARENNGGSASPGTRPAVDPGDRVGRRLYWLRGDRRQARASTHWYHCLLFPVLAWGRMIVLGCSVPFALVLAFKTIQLFLLGEAPAAVYLLGLLGVAAVSVLAQLCVWFLGILAFESIGRMGTNNLSWIDIKLTARCVAGFALTFLCGPLLFAGLALWFWIRSGKLLIIDWLILGELTFFMAGSLLFGLLEICQSPHPRPPDPGKVLELLQRLGWRALVAAGLAWLVFVLHGRLFIAAWWQLIDHGQGGWLVISGLSGVVCTSIVLRLTGMWARQTNLD